MKMKPTVQAAVAAFLMCTMATAADAPKADTLFKDEVVAKGKGVSVMRSELDDQFTLFKANVAARSQTVPDEQQAMIEGELLNKIVVQQLLLARATVEDKTKSKDVAVKFIAESKKMAPNEDSFKRQLLASGLTLEKFEKQVMEQAICEEVINREVRSGIKVADADVQKFFNDNKAKMDAPEMVRAAHILVGTTDALTGESLAEEKKKAKLKLAESLRDRARKGEDFAKLAKEFSDDPGSKDKGGEYTFPKGQMVPEFEKTAFGLKTNEVSDVVVTQYGYHIIKLAEKIPAKKADLKSQETTIKDYLSRLELQKAMPLFFEKIKKEADVQILLPKVEKK